MEVTRRSKIWLLAAALFAVANLASAVVAAVQGEMLHAGAHVGLLLLGASLTWWLARKRYGHRIWPREEAAISGELIDNMTTLKQSVDAVAIEVERIGEGQRFMTRFFTENGIPRAPGEGIAEPIEIKRGEAAPPVRGY